MSMRSLAIAIAFLAVFAMALRFSIDTDTWWHLRTGELILEQGSIPKTDTFSYTRNGETWRYPSAAWLSEVTLFFLYSQFGPAGLNVFLAGMVTLAFGFVFATLSGGHFLRAFTLIIAATVSAIFWAARPYLATFVLSAVFLWILEDYRWGRNNRLTWLPVLMIFWANSHPGFAFGFMLLGIYGLDRVAAQAGEYWKKRNQKRAKKNGLKIILRGQVGALILTGLAMLVAVCINPSGPALLKYPFETVSIGVLRDFIQEWQSPDFHQISAQPFAWLLLATLAAVGLSREKIVLSDLLLVVVPGYMALLAGRNIALFALSAPAVLTRHADPLFADFRKWIGNQNLRQQKTTRLQSALNVIILILVLFAVGAKAAVVLPENANRAVYEKSLPVAAVELIQGERPAGRLFSSYNWGGYLIWTLRDYPVFADGRTDLYSDDILEQWLAVVRAEQGWQESLTSWDVRLVLLEPHIPLSKVLPGEGWTLVYKDDVSVLFQR